MWHGRRATNVGLMLVIFSPDFDFTNSLLMKIPIGCLYFRPLGAVSSTERSDILLPTPLKVRMVAMEMLGRRAKPRNFGSAEKLKSLFSI
jgi:hypothetical protein